MSNAYEVAPRRQPSKPRGIFDCEPEEEMHMTEEEKRIAAKHRLDLKASQDKYAERIFKLGEAFHEGTHGLQKNTKNAQFRWETAAELGHRGARHRLAELRTKKADSIRKDREARQAAERARLELEAAREAALRAEEERLRRAEELKRERELALLADMERQMQEEEDRRIREEEALRDHELALLMQEQARLEAAERTRVANEEARRLRENEEARLRRQREEEARLREEERQREEERRQRQQAAERERREAEEAELERRAQEEHARLLALQMAAAEEAERLRLEEEERRYQEELKEEHHRRLEEERLAQEALEKAEAERIAAAEEELRLAAERERELAILIEEEKRMEEAARLAAAEAKRQAEEERRLAEAKAKAEALEHERELQLLRLEAERLEEEEKKRREQERLAREEAELAAAAVKAEEDRIKAEEENAESARIAKERAPRVVFEIQLESYTRAHMTRPLQDRFVSDMAVSLELHTDQVELVDGAIRDAEVGDGIVISVKLRGLNSAEHAEILWETVRDLSLLRALLVENVWYDYRVTKITVVPIIYEESQIWLMVSGADSRIGEEDPSNGVVKYDENTPEEIADDAEVVYQELSPREKAILEETRALREGTATDEAIGADVYDDGSAADYEEKPVSWKFPWEMSDEDRAAAELAEQERLEQIEKQRVQKEQEEAWEKHLAELAEKEEVEAEAEAQRQAEEKRKRAALEAERVALELEMAEAEAEAKAAADKFMQAEEAAAAESAGGTKRKPELKKKKSMLGRFVPSFRRKSSKKLRTGGPEPIEEKRESLAPVDTIDALSHYYDSALDEISDAQRQYSDDLYELGNSIYAQNLIEVKEEDCTDGDVADLICGEPEQIDKETKSTQDKKRLILAAARWESAAALGHRLARARLDELEEAIEEARLSGSDIVEMKKEAIARERTRIKQAQLAELKVKAAREEAERQRKIDEAKKAEEFLLEQERMRETEEELRREAEEIERQRQVYLTQEQIRQRMADLDRRVQTAKEQEMAEAREGTEKVKKVIDVEREIEAVEVEDLTIGVVGEQRSAEAEEALRRAEDAARLAAEALEAAHVAFQRSEEESMRQRELVKERKLQLQSEAQQAALEAQSAKAALVQAEERRKKAEDAQRRYLETGIYRPAEEDSWLSDLLPATPDPVAGSSDGTNSIGDRGLGGVVTAQASPPVHVTPVADATPTASAAPESASGSWWSMTHQHTQAHGDAATDTPLAANTTHSHMGWWGGGSGAAQEESKEGSTGEGDADASGAKGDEESELIHGQTHQFHWPWEAKENEGGRENEAEKEVEGPPGAAGEVAPNGQVPEETAPPPVPRPFVPYGGASQP